VLLRASITISFLTLAFGIVATLLNLEKFPTKLLATIYCLASLIARFAVFTAMFVEFGYEALYFFIPAYFVRVIVVNVIYLKENEPGCEEFFVFQPMVMFDHALTFILPFGKVVDDNEKNVLLALQGAQNDPIVTCKLLSPLALGNLALTLLENGIGWLFVCLIDSDANVTMWYFYTCGLGMMGLMIVTLPLTYASSKLLGLASNNSRGSEERGIRI
jgi:hypothetical protein